MRFRSTVDQSAMSGQYIDGVLASRSLCVRWLALIVVSLSQVMLFLEVKAEWAGSALKF